MLSIFSISLWKSKIYKPSPLVRDFIFLFFPFALYQMISRGIHTVDLWVLTKLGEIYTAVHAVPTSALIFDAILFFSIISIISVTLRKEKLLDHKREISQMTLIVFLFALLFTPISIYFSIHFIDLTVSNLLIYDLSKKAITLIGWFTPIRAVNIVLSTSLFVLGNGSILIILYSIIFVANIFLDHLFVFTWDMGYMGVYFNRCICDLLTLSALLIYMYLKEDFFSFCTLPSMQWMRSFFSKAISELLRYFSRFVGSIVIFKIVQSANQIAQLTVYSVSGQMYSIVGYISAAFMRSLSVLLVRNHYEKERLADIQKHFSHLLRTVFVFISCYILLLFLCSKWIGNNFFSLSPTSMEWFFSFICIQCVHMPILFKLQFLNAICLSKHKFKFLSIIDALCMWGIHIPLFYLGISRDHPWLAWSGFLFRDIVQMIVIIVVLNKKRSPQVVLDKEHYQTTSVSS